MLKIYLYSVATLLNTMYNKFKEPFRERERVFLMEEMAVRGMGALITAGTAASGKVAENVANRALNWVVDNMNAAKGNVKAAFKTGFTRYLQNAELRYNQVRTLTTTSSPRSIVGPDSIYVNIGVQHNKRVIATDSVEDMLRISNHILLIGTGGIGKSMLLRYLFINTVHRGTYVPVLLELRKISNQTSGAISVEDLIYSCMEDFDVQLPRAEFEYSLRLGSYLFLLDGFDEVKSDMAPAAAEAIQSFCSKYPKNCCIVTSRPREASAHLQTFAVMEAMPLSKAQAVLLASKIWPNDDKTKDFCRQLDEHLYDRHQEFAQNPLLLTMMFLTFMRNNSIPNHLSEFYEKAFEALYSAHDNNDKGVYHREFKCKDLDEATFKHILSHFCFHSYVKEKYEFEHDELIEFLGKSISKANAVGITAVDYLEDLRKVVCFMVKDGLVYRFAHRSFQAYFAAYYTKNYLTDEFQKSLFKKLLSEQRFVRRFEYYRLLQQMQYERFVENALEPGLREMYMEAMASDDPELHYLREIFEGVRLFPGKTYWQMPDLPPKKEYRGNLIHLFRLAVPSKRGGVMRRIGAENWRERLLPFGKKESEEDQYYYVPLSDVEFSTEISDEEKAELILIFKDLALVSGVHECIKEMLSEIDAKRAKMEDDDFFDSL